MSWEDRYQQGSFRGAKFLTESHDLEGGRRVAQHEYPQRDIPFCEDLGARGKRYSIECLVMGADHMEQRDALMTALDAFGKGVLIHPYFGQIDVNCETYNLSEDTSQGGLSRFSVSFLESGRAQVGDSRDDTSGASAAKAAAAQAAAPTVFANDFVVAGYPAFVEDGAAGLLQTFTISSTGAARLLGGAGKALRAYEAGIEQLDSAITLVRTPITLAETVRGVVRSVAGLAAVPLLRINALRSIFASPAKFRTVLGQTPARNRERDNQQAMINLVEAVTAAEIVRAAATTRFGSYQEAAALRDLLSDDLDRASYVAADRGDDDHANLLDSLRRAMIRDATARGASLARLFSYTPKVTEPALVIANRIYGAANVQARSAEIVTRNRVRHPGFVPGAIPLELLTRIDAAGGTGDAR